jgi:ABC-type glycerol-3-phosphate transport system permease component
MEMNWDALLAKVETSAIIDYLQALDLHTLVHHPYFLSGTGALAIIAMLMRWRVLLVTILTVSGFAWLLAYTLERGASLEGGIGNETLMLFVGGGAVIVFGAIYFLFIRSE